MPVRSRGSLLAGTTLVGLVMALIGCHASPADHDSFAIPSSPASSSAGLFSSHSTAPAMAAAPNQPVIGYSPTVHGAPASNPVTLQPVPVTQNTAGNREVIASSWQPVQRVRAEQLANGPDLQGNPAKPTIATTIPALPTRMPVGTPTSRGSGTVLSATDTPPSGTIVLPAPRPLGTPVPTSVVYDPMMAMPHAPMPNVPREFEKMALPPYVVEPPDLLLIQASDRVTLLLQRITGQHLVAPDGTINLGIYGRIRVAGMTLDQVADAVAMRLLELMPGLLRNAKPPKTPVDPTTGKPDKKLEELWSEKDWHDNFTTIDLIKKEMQVDVLSYNSKYFYVITDGGGYGQQIYPFLITGNETVLDALAKINGLPSVANKKRVWVARATRAGQPPKVMPVDWLAVTKCGSGATNYQIFPGDRVYVDSDPWIKADTWLSKRLSPVLRGFGATLLGASTVNAIKFGASSGSGLGGVGAFR